MLMLAALLLRRLTCRLLLITLQRALSPSHLVFSRSSFLSELACVPHLFLVFGDSSSRRPRHFRFLAILAPPQDLAQGANNLSTLTSSNSAKTSATPRQLGKPSLLFRNTAVPLLRYILCPKCSALFDPPWALSPSLLLCPRPRQHRVLQIPVVPPLQKK